jgi:hypothetical protein
MALLSAILQSKYTGAGTNFVLNPEENLEKGSIWVFTEGNVYGTKFAGPSVCWKSPGAGTVEVEVWGAGGSSGQMCCCGFGIQGNAGAYSKRTFAVTASGYITGCIGVSCGNSSAICFRGCSEPSGLCWRAGDGGNGCMCSQGGQGGITYCNTGVGSPFMCYCTGGFCATTACNIPGANGSGVCCGIVCTYGTATGLYIACAYGGDINCCGSYNCSFISSCCANNPCQYIHSAYIPPGIISTGGTRVIYQTETDTGYGTLNGGALNPFLMGLNAASKNPAMGQGFTHCMGGVNRTCGCYEHQGCNPWLPIGVGGLAVTPCDGVRDHAWRGGMGAIKIKWYSN